MPDFDQVQILILSSIEWDAAWQRHQIFAWQLAAAGHEVFFVENSGFRDPGLRDVPRLWHKLQSFVLPAEESSQDDLPPRLRVFPARLLPPTNAAFRRANAAFFIPQLAASLRAAGLRRHPLIVSYFPTATTLELIRRIEPCALVYDCASNFRAHPHAPPDFARQERDLLERTDLVVCDSDFLYEQKRAEHGRVVQIHQGVPEEFFRAKPPAADYRRLCYYGTWQQKDEDPAFLAALAEAGFEVTVSGFLKGSPPPFPPGVRHLPPVRREELIERLEDFDAFILPYRINPFLMGVIPAKIYESLAMGRPVLATPLPSFAPLGRLVHIADTPARWVELARALPKTETAALRDERIALAREHSCAREFQRFRQALRQAWEHGLLHAPAAAEPAGKTAPPPWWERSHMRSFLRGFTWIGLLYGLAKVSTLLTQVAAGRLLGPLQYGTANLIVAIAAFLQILPMMGFQWALSKYPPNEPSLPARRRLISTALTMFGAWGSLCLALLVLLRGPLGRAIAVPPSLVDHAILFAFCTAVYMVISSPLLGLQRFAQRGLAEALYGFCAPLFLFAFIAHGMRTYHALIISLCMSLLVGTAYSAWSLRHYLRPALDPVAVRAVSGFALVAALNLLTTACVLAPGRLILNRCFSPHEVGVFSAYFTATVQISLVLIYILTAVLVPLASTPEGQAEAWHSFRAAGLPLILLAALLFALTAGAGLLLFGRQYPFHWAWTAPFALAAALILVHGIAGAVFMARDFSGLRISVTGNLIAGSGNITLGLVLIPRWGIPGAGAALAGAYLVGLAYYYLQTETRRSEL